jgi:hypothetical protein
MQRRHTGGRHTSASTAPRQRAQPSATDDRCGDTFVRNNGCNAQNPAERDRTA